jgi:hypothetical protein
MKAIVRNFGGEEVLNTLIDTVIFSFPITSEPSSDKTPFKDALKCGLAMQTAHDDMNQKYHEEGLPPINYRISADCGKIEMQVEATCLNIYTKAPPNRMVIGENLYVTIKHSFERDYHFTKIYEYPPDKDPDKTSYPVYFNPYSVYLIS